jgi:hypothetical protein
LLHLLELPPLLDSPLHPMHKLIPRKTAKPYVQASNA